MPRAKKKQRNVQFAPDVSRQGVYQWVWRYLRKYRACYLLAIASSLFLVFSGFVSPVVTGKIVDNALRGNQLRLIWVYLAILLAVTLSRSVIRMAASFLYTRAALGSTQAMQEDFYRRLGSYDFQYFDNNRAGDLINRCSSDIDQVRSFLSDHVRALIENSAPLPTALILLMYYDASLALITLSLAVPLAIAALRLSKKVRPRFAEARKQSSRLAEYVQENIAANRVVKSFCRQTYEINRFDLENSKLSQMNQETARINAAYSPIIEALSMCFTLAVLLIGGLMVIHGRMSLGGLIVFNNSIWSIRQPVMSLPGILNGWQRFLASGERALEAIRFQPKIVNPAKPAKPSKARGEIIFDDVSFRYNPQNPWVLRHIDVLLEPNSFVGLIGPTGSGKSTLAKLLMRFYDVTHGRILLDGVDIKNYSLNDLRARIAFAMQDVFLFSESVKNNICYFLPESGHNIFVKRAQQACAHDFIERLPEGYETVIGERGAGLSGGQRQRLALARMLMKNGYAVVLDSVTSALDSATEMQLISNLMQMEARFTTLMITHRAAVLEKTSRIIVLEGGRIVQIGSHTELFGQHGYYREAVLRQQNVGGGKAFLA